MNTKLRTRFSYSSVVEKRRGSTGSRIDELVTVIVTKLAHTDKPVVQFSLHARAVEDAGWKPGDTIGFDYDEGAVCLYKDKDGRKLTKTGSGSAERRSYLRFGSLPKEFVSIFVARACINVEIEGGRMAFDLQDMGTREAA